jgi:DNA topoisomerase-2
MTEVYKKHTHREHILELPDTYIGSTETSEEHRWIFDKDEGKMQYKKIHFNPGFYKIFDEIVVNARDALVRSQVEPSRIPVKRIDITAGDTDGKFTISVKNDGDGIPIQMHETEKCWNPELIFGHLLTSSNYNKNEEKIVGGKNGYGSKACNIFSESYKISIRDPKSQQRYEQVWKNNMSICEKPHIVKDKASKGYVEVTFVPDLKRFHGLKKEDMLSVLHTRTIELAALVGKDVKVTWNGEEIKTDTFEKFVKLFLKEDSEKMLAYERCSERWEVAAVLTSSLFSDDIGTPDDRHISFVNGINTRKGGKHVESVQRHVLSDVCEAASKKKKLDLKPGQIKDSITLFVNATIVNPSFDSQTKETLTTPAAKFGSSVSISPKFVESLIKAGILEEAQNILAAKTAKDAKKTDGAKKRTIYGLPKLEDALLAGTAKSSECTLILTEGDSAATSAIAGLKVVGRERWGVFPLRGKLLNVKDIGREKFNANEELTAIKKILGLEQGKKYDSVASLRYGRVLIMSDQDVDGFHIRGLLMNLFHTEWPNLMHMGFLCSLMTPLVKMTRGSETLSFYSEAELESWREQVGAEAASRYKSKYYKGLGTSTPAEAREWFENLSDIRYEWDETTDQSMNLAFSKKLADERKAWLATYDPKRSIQPVVDGSGKKKVPYSRFVHDELIHFSNADNLRSLPHIIDGLKPSQRKILFGCFKRNLKSEIRVAQLAGYVSEHAAYHHGEASLNQTITSMAQIFVGANNINLLAPVGQYGSRLMGGKDAASPRYIHTHFEPIVDSLFRKEDAPILNHLEDDGDVVEPETYYPVLPMLAVNGSVGIGTGFSTDIPPHNPEEIVSLLKGRLNGSIETLAKKVLNPWWIGFKGAVEKKDDQHWITRAVYTWNDAASSVHISELPVGVWTKDYKAFLDTMVQGEGPGAILEEKVEKEKVKKGTKAKKGDDAASVSSDGKKKKGKPVLKGFDDLYNDVDVNFVLYLEPEFYQKAKLNPVEFEKTFHLTSSWKTTNMCCFDPNMCITKYETIGDILEQFFVHRLVAYEKRRQHQIGALKDVLEELNAKLCFVKAIVEGRLKLLNEEDDVILKGLKTLELPPRSNRSEPDSLGAYEYLLKMRVDRIKKKSVEEAEKDVEVTLKKLAELESTTATAMWSKELDEFLEAWGHTKKHIIEHLSASNEKALPSQKKKVVSMRKGK